MLVPLIDWSLAVQTARYGSVISPCNVSSRRKRTMTNASTMIARHNTGPTAPGTCKLRHRGFGRWQAALIAALQVEANGVPLRLSAQEAGGYQDQRIGSPYFSGTETK